MFLDHVITGLEVISWRTERPIVLPNGTTLKSSIRHGGHLRIISMPAEDARGPCWARYLAQLLWENEELYFGSLKRVLDRFQNAVVL